MIFDGPGEFTFRQRAALRHVRVERLPLADRHPARAVWVSGRDEEI
jgi:hypothetical protein